MKNRTDIMLLRTAQLSSQKRTPHAPNHYCNTLQAWIKTIILLHNRASCWFCMHGEPD